MVKRGLAGADALSMHPTAARPDQLPFTRAWGVRRWLVLAVAGSLLLCAVNGLLNGSVATAETAADAKARAEVAAAEVAALQDEVDAAQAEYERALRGISWAVSSAVHAEQLAQMAIEAEQYAALQRVQALRALNQSGGSFGTMETVFAAETPGEMTARWQLNQQVFDLLANRSTEATGFTGAALANVRKASKYADLQVASVDDVQAVYERLESLLSRQQEILDQLDARAARLVEAEQAAERLAAQRAEAEAAASSGASQVTASGIPRDYLALYQAAAQTCPGLPWPVLAAIGQVESGHGTNTGPSSAGAQGPMQFLPSTFAAYAVDGDNDGDRDIWDPADAIYSAANYLCANGAGGGPRALYNALWHYNHADWYVLMVANVAGQIARRFDEPIPEVQAS